VLRGFSNLHPVGNPPVSRAHNADGVVTGIADVKAGSVLRKGGIVGHGPSLDGRNNRERPNIDHGHRVLIGMGHSGGGTIGRRGNMMNPTRNVNPTNHGTIFNLDEVYAAYDGALRHRSACWFRVMRGMVFRRHTRRPFRYCGAGFDLREAAGDKELPVGRLGKPVDSLGTPVGRSGTWFVSTSITAIALFPRMGTKTTCRTPAEAEERAAIAK